MQACGLGLSNPWTPRYSKHAQVGCSQLFDVRDGYRSTWSKTIPATRKPGFREPVPQLNIATFIKDLLASRLLLYSCRIFRKSLGKLQNSEPIEAFRQDSVIIALSREVPLHTGIGKTWHSCWLKRRAAVGRCSCKGLTFRGGAPPLDRHVSEQHGPVDPPAAQGKISM